jgi:hypothetical protein
MNITPKVKNRNNSNPAFGVSLGDDLFSLQNCYHITMHKLDYLARFFLSFSHLLPVVVLSIVGFLAINRRLFTEVLFLVLFTFIFNPWLKFLFHIPLAPELHIQGFAFPSGHMQFAWVFYGWLLWHTSDRRLQAILIAVLVGISWGLVHFGYHNWFDIGGALGFGGMTMLGFRYLPRVLCLATLLGLASVFCLWLWLMATVPVHSQVAYCVLLVLNGIWFVRKFPIQSQASIITE